VDLQEETITRMPIAIAQNRIVICGVVYHDGTFDDADWWLVAICTMPNKAGACVLKLYVKLSGS